MKWTQRIHYGTYKENEVLEFLEVGLGDKEDNFDSLVIASATKISLN